MRSNDPKRRGKNKLRKATASGRCRGSTCCTRTICAGCIVFFALKRFDGNDNSSAVETAERREAPLLPVTPLPSMLQKAVEQRLGSVIHTRCGDHFRDEFRVRQANSNGAVLSSAKTRECATRWRLTMAVTDRLRRIHGSTVPRFHGSIRDCFLSFFSSAKECNLIPKSRRFVNTRWDVDFAPRLWCTMGRCLDASRPACRVSHARVPRTRCFQTGPTILNLGMPRTPD